MIIMKKKKNRGCVIIYGDFLRFNNVWGYLLNVKVWINIMDLRNLVVKREIFGDLYCINCDYSRKLNLGYLKLFIFCWGCEFNFVLFCK